MRLLAALALSLLAPLALAQNLSQEKAGQFVESLAEVNRFGQSVDSQLSGEMLNQSFMPEPGQAFEPYTGSMSYIEQEHPEIHAELAGIVEDFGFSSVSEWAETGDQVVGAYLALELDQEEIAQITPEMLEQMPPQMRPQMERVMAMVEAVRNTPEDNIEVVRPLKSRLDQQLGSMAPAP